MIKDLKDSVGVNSQLFYKVIRKNTLCQVFFIDIKALSIYIKQTSTKANIISFKDLRVLIS